MQWKVGCVDDRQKLIASRGLTQIVAGNYEEELIIREDNERVNQPELRSASPAYRRVKESHVKQV